MIFFQCIFESEIKTPQRKFKLKNLTIYFNNVILGKNEEKMVNCINWRISEINFKTHDGFVVEVHCMKSTPKIGEIHISSNFQRVRDEAAVVHYIELKRRDIIDRCEKCKKEGQA